MPAVAAPDATDEESPAATAHPAHPCLIGGAVVSVGGATLAVSGVGVLRATRIGLMFVPR